LFKRRNWKIEIKEKKEAYYLHFFIDLEGQGHLPTYPWGIKTS